MKTKAWHVLCFILVIIGLTVLLFPTKRVLIPLYIDEGMLKKAESSLQLQLAHDRYDPRLLNMSSRLFLLMGEPHKAIEALEGAIQKHPRNLSDLTRLATLYEWNRDPKAAMKVWARIAEFHPQEREAWAKLIDYYRYYGYPEKEAFAIIRLILLDKRLPPEQIAEDPLIRLMTGELDRLVAQHEKEKDDPYINALLSALYLIRKQYAEDIAGSVTVDSDDREDAIMRCIEAFVRTDRLRMGMSFASSLDRKEGKGIKYRFDMVKALGWYGMDEQALAMLRDLNRADPGNREILLAMARIGAQESDPKAAVYAYEQLLLKDPVRDDYRQQLAELYMRADAPRKAFYLYVQLAESTKGDVEYVNKLIQSAGFTGDSVLQEEAVKIASRLRPDDPFVLKTMADLYLSQDQPGRAYPIFVRLARLSGQDRADVLKTLQVAGYTGDKKVIRAALAVAIKAWPDDHEIVKEAAKMYLWIDQPDKAYPLLRKIALWSGGDTQSVDQMIQAARFTGKTALIRDALVLSKRLRPTDAAIQLKLAEFYLGNGQQRKAIIAYRDYLRLRPADEQAEKQLARIYLWTDQPKKAFDRMLRVAEMSGGRKGPLMEAARLAEQAGLSEEAYRLYKKLYLKYPNDTVVQDHLIRLASWTDRRGEAAAILGDLSKKDPGNFQRALAAGDAYIESGNVKVGIPFLEDALKIMPGEVSLRRRLVTYYGWVGPADKLIGQLEYLDGRGLLRAEDHIVLARIYLDRRDGIKALDHLKHLEGRKKLPGKGGIMLANAYELAGMNEAAMKIYRRLARENSENARFLARLGNQALWLKRTALALRFFEMSLKRDPKNLVALKGSAQVYAWNNDPERAIRRFRAYNRLNPDDLEVRYQLGELYFGNGRKGEAFKEYKKTLSLIKQLEVSRSRGAAPHGSGQHSSP